MAEKVEIYRHLKDDKRTKKEIGKLKTLFNDLPKDKKTLCQKLIENAGFMAVMLEELQEDIRSNGYKEEYRNGENQYGFKRSIAADLYQVTVKNYSNAIKQLSDLLPKNNGMEESDGFEEFVNGRDDI